MWLHVRSGPGAGAAVELPGDRPFVLGRQAGTDLVVRDERASRRHLELVPLGDGRWRMTDLGTANGTTLDGIPVRTAVLEGGEDLRIGDVVIGVSVASPDGEVRQPPAAPRPAAAPELATRSMVLRMVATSTRRSRRVVVAAGALVAVAAVVVVILITRGSADERLPAVLARVTPSLVLLTTGDAGMGGTGSGWRLAPDAVVTAAHVVNQGPAVRTPAGAATVLGVAPCEDLAVLRAPGRGTPARLSADPAATGETVVATGFQPGSKGAIATRGVVSSVGVAVTDPAPDVPAYGNVLQTDTALNPGLSGGPLLDLDGRVVAVDVAARSTGSDGRALQGVNYAVPIARALPVLRGLRAGRSTAWTGFTFAYPTDAELREADLPPGLRITGAVPGTPAAKAGLAPGTLIAGVDGEAIENTLASLCDRLQGRVTGDEVVLNVVVPGRAQTRQVRLRLA